jgi:hypothetical protein
MVTTITGTVDYTEAIPPPYTTTVTATTTVFAKRKRDALPQPTAAAVLRRDASVASQVSAVVQSAAFGSYDPSVMTQWAPEVSSVCACLNLGPLTTVTVTSAAAASVSIQPFPKACANCF